jgi:hypothetical protein
MGFFPGLFPCKPAFSWQLSTLRVKLSMAQNMLWIYCFLD